MFITGIIYGFLSNHPYPSCLCSWHPYYYPSYTASTQRDFTAQGCKGGNDKLILQHTSASLTLNENADPDVRLDTEDWLNKVAPADQPQYRHTLEDRMICRHTLKV